jgi:hypothetical protein
MVAAALCNERILWMSCIKLSKADVELAIKYYVRDKMGLNRIALPGDVRVLTPAGSVQNMVTNEQLEAEVEIIYRQGENDAVEEPFQGMFDQLFANPMKRDPDRRHDPGHNS